MAPPSAAVEAAPLAHDARLSTSTDLFHGIDWTYYRDARPAWPPSTLALLLAHHRQHSNRFALAHDVGAGDAVFTPQLLPWFAHVHTSDPSPANVRNAQAKLETLPAPRPQLSFSVGGAEDMDQPRPPGSVDFVSVMEALHWADSAASIAAAARSLRPGGTLALALYNIGVAIPPVCAASRAVARAFDAMMPELFRSGYQRAPEALQRRLLRASAQQATAYSHVLLPARDWRLADCRRVWINSHGRGERAFQHITSGISMALDAGAPLAECCVDARERVEYYDGADVEAREWTRWVDRHWFKEYLATVMVVGDFYQTPHWRAFERVLEDELGEGRICVEWPVNIVLATRR